MSKKNIGKKKSTKSKTPENGKQNFAVKNATEKKGNKYERKKSAPGNSHRQTLWTNHLWQGDKGVEGQHSSNPLPSLSPPQHRTSSWQIALAPKLNHQREWPKKRPKRNKDRGTKGLGLQRICHDLPQQPTAFQRVVGMRGHHPWSTLHLAHPFACRLSCDSN